MIRILTIASLLIFSACQTTPNGKNLSKKTNDVISPSPGQRALIAQVCSDSGHKVLCYRTMAIALHECNWLAALRVNHARCILGSIQDQMKGSKVKYLLLGGRQ